MMFMIMSFGINERHNDIIVRLFKHLGELLPIHHATSGGASLTSMPHDVVMNFDHSESDKHLTWIAYKSSTSNCAMPFTKAQ